MEYPDGFAPLAILQVLLCCGLACQAWHLLLTIFRAPRPGARRFLLFAYHGRKKKTRSCLQVRILRRERGKRPFLRRKSTLMVLDQSKKGRLTKLSDKRRYLETAPSAKVLQSQKITTSTAPAPARVLTQNGIRRTKKIRHFGNPNRTGYDGKFPLKPRTASSRGSVCPLSASGKLFIPVTYVLDTLPP